MCLKKEHTHIKKNQYFVDRGGGILIIVLPSYCIKNLGTAAAVSVPEVTKAGLKLLEPSPFSHALVRTSIFIIRKDPGFNTLTQQKGNFFVE